MTLKLGLILSSLLLCLCGCVTMGRKVSGADARSFVVGSSNLSDVEAKLGPPTNTVETSDGIKVLTYQYIHSQPNAGAFVPLVGPLVGGVNTEGEVFTYYFGKDGILTNFVQSQVHQ